MISEETIQTAVELLKSAAAPSRIILFGSYARGDARDTSDLDFLVTQPVVTARRREMVRLSDVLRPLRLPADVLVVSDRTFEEWRHIPGTVLYQANKEGRVLYAAEEGSPLAPP
jgi:predicted nucleotidyltransferase